MGLAALALALGVAPACLSFGEGFERGFRSSLGFDVLWTTYAWSPDGRSLLHSDGGEGLSRSDLDLDGSEPVRVVECGSFPAYSPDGSRIALIVLEPLDPESPPSSERRGDLWLMNADGTDRRRIERGWAVPVWSPDGRWLAITDLEPEEPVIALLRPDGGERRELGRGGLPVWSPDGSRIACTLATDQDEWPGIAVVESDGTGWRRLIRGSWPSWSPDGRWLAFQDVEATADGDSNAVFVIGADGSECRRLGPGTFPSWSPVDDRILFYRPADDALVTVASDGTDERVLASGGPGLWSPDGTRVVFLRPSDVAVVDAEGGEARALFPAFCGIPAVSEHPTL